VNPKGRTREDAEAESELLRAGKLVGERDVTPESLVGGDEQAAGGAAGVVGTDRSVDVASVEGDVVVLRRAGLAGPDRSDVEGEPGGTGCALAEGGGGGDDTDDGEGSAH